jgi:hypothetical protein
LIKNNIKIFGLFSRKEIPRKLMASLLMSCKSGYFGSKFVAVEYSIPKQLLKSDSTKNQLIEESKQSKSSKWSWKRHEDWVNRMFGELKKLVASKKKVDKQSQKQKSKESQKSEDNK